jgi:hypothetical protein
MTLTDFCKKSMSKTNSEKIENTFFVDFFVLCRKQVFRRFFYSIAVSGVSQRWEFKNTTKNVLQKQSCRNVFTKHSAKNPKPIPSPYFYHGFGRFSVRGVQKHDMNKISKNKSDPGPFLASGDPPTHHGGHRICLAAPCRTYRRIEKKKNTAVLTAHRKHKLRRSTAGFNREQAKKPKHRQRPGQTPSHLTTANFQLPATTTTQGRIFLPLEGRPNKNDVKKEQAGHCFSLFFLALFLAFLERPCQKLFTEKNSLNKKSIFVWAILLTISTLRFGAFLAKGNSKTPQKYRQNIAISRQNRPTDRPPSSISVCFCFLGHPCAPRCRQNKIDGPPPVHLLNPRPTHPPSDFFSLIFFSTFLGVSQQGQFKNAIFKKMQKVHVENFSPKKSTKKSMSVFIDFFWFYRVFGCFSATGVQKHHKKRLAKKSRRKVFTKNSAKNPKPIPSRYLLIPFLPFFGEGGLKTRHKQNIKHRGRN